MKKSDSMFEVKSFEHLIGTSGFSEQLLKNHFTLYQGYVNNTNKLEDILSKIDKSSPEFAELKRRFGWEFNGMRLHELYFGNMKNNSKTPDGVSKNISENSKLFEKIIEQFDSFENWEKEFRAIGAMRGIGWVVLYYDQLSNKLFNVWINEHDVGHLSGAVPILVMDVFEHAFMIDYGLKRADYIEAFFRAIDWSVVEKRYEKHNPHLSDS